MNKLIPQLITSGMIGRRANRSIPSVKKCMAKLGIRPIAIVGRTAVYSAEDADRVVQSIAETATRRQGTDRILAVLANGPATTRTIRRATGMTPSHISTSLYRLSRRGRVVNLGPQQWARKD